MTDFKDLKYVERNDRSLRNCNKCNKSSTLGESQQPGFETVTPNHDTLNYHSKCATFSRSM